jgi:hypothetical protein
MPATLDSQTLTVRIECDLRSAYAFLTAPESFSRWASGLGKGLKRTGDAWVVETPEGQVEVWFSEPNDFGILDHRVRLPSGQEIAVPMRIIANGGGCEVLFTLLRVPGMSEAQFAADAGWVRNDLRTLKALLEENPRPGIAAA